MLYIQICLPFYGSRGSCILSDKLKLPGEDSASDFDEECQMRAENGVVHGIKSWDSPRPGLKQGAAAHGTPALPAVAHRQLQV